MKHFLIGNTDCEYIRAGDEVMFLRGCLISVCAVLLGSYKVTAQKSFYDSLSVRQVRLKEEAWSYAKEHGLPTKRVFDDGQIIELQYLDNGLPTYYVTHNAKAAFTTSTSQLFKGGNLGLDLTGKGINVYVWDGGIVFGTHVELAGRAQQLDGSLSVSDHSTHVSGTIAATGINPLARGMANQAKIKSFDWNLVEAEMETQASQGALLSNHSWGLGLGWQFDSSNGSWNWNGDPAISTQEDYRFGLYTSRTATWDRITYDHPYFLIVKSAGNDRNDTGSGVGAPADGPYDIIGPLSAGKNSLTVGAVNPLTSAYTGPASVVETSFSSWGPTDDGRIKPDICADGVNVFSITASSTTAYESKSGTSMAAPNTTGSLALLQELYKRYHAKYMLAATLKGLVIATAQEAGAQAGPDYKFGWGLLDTERAARLIKVENGNSYQIVEATLNDQAAYQQILSLKQGHKVKVTICWSDSPGPVASGVLDPPDLRLINDLDLRIKKGATTFFPWQLNPETKLITKGDNFRDNVEQVEFVVPEDGDYEISVTHKNSITNGSQAFSLIVFDTDLDTRNTALYATSLSGNWSDNSQWATDSSGTAASRVPGMNDVVIFADNAPSFTVSLDTDVEVFDLSMLGVNNHEIDLNGHTLAIHGSINLANGSAKVKNGTLKLSGSNGKSFVSIGGVLENVNLLISGSNAVNLQTSLTVDTIQIDNGQFQSLGKTINASAFIEDSPNPKHIILKSSIINAQSILQRGSNMTSDVSGSIVKLTGEKSKFDSELQFDCIEVLADSNKVKNATGIQKIVLSGITEFESNCSVDSLQIKQAKGVRIQSGSTLTISKDITLTELQPDFHIKASGVGEATIDATTNQKICLGVIEVESVTLTGNTLFVIDPLSTINNISNWSIGVCEEILFAQYSYINGCALGVTSFMDTSDGNVTSWSWDFGDNSGTATDENPTHVFQSEGQYEVTLTVGDGVGSHQWTGMVNIIKSNINQPSIIENGGKLRSTAFASAYQWYLDGELLVGETTSTLSNYEEPGDYTIEIYNSTCRMRSTPFTVSITDVEQEFDNQLSVFPNPADDLINIQGIPLQEVGYTIVNSVGQVVKSGKLSAIQPIRVDDLGPGLYTLSLEFGSERVRQRIVVKH